MDTLNNKIKTTIFYDKETDTIFDKASIFNEITAYNFFGSEQGSEKFVSVDISNLYYFKNYVIGNLYYIGLLSEADYNSILDKQLTFDYLYNTRYFKSQFKALFLAIQNLASITYSHSSGCYYNYPYTESMEHYLATKVAEKYQNEHKVVYEEKPVDANSDNNLSWDSYFMGVAKMAAKRSKDPSCKVGACICKDNKIISTGYNGFPRGLSDKDYPWTKGSEDETKNKYFYVVHAELNAILNSNNNVSGSTLYVTKFPCNECCKAIIQSGIKKVIYTDSLENQDLVKDEKIVAAMKMLYNAKITVDRYKSQNISINIDL